MGVEWGQEGTVVSGCTARMRRGGLPVLFLLCACARGGERQATAAEVLAACCGLSGQDLAALDRGQPIGRLIRLSEDGDTGDNDIAILGAIRLNVPKEAYLEWYKRVSNYTYSALVKEAVPFHVPPRAEDLAAVTLDSGEVRALRECRVGKCGLKLTAEEIAHVRSEVNWSSVAADTAAAQARDVIRNILLRQVERYVREGDAALPRYVDKGDTPRDVAATFQSLVEASAGYIGRAFPDVYARLRNHPAANGDGAVVTEDDILYWSLEGYGFGLKSLLNVVHARIHHVSPTVTVVSTKQLRATHYFEGYLGFAVLVDAGGRGSYLVYMNRSRIDLLRDAGIKKWLVRRFAPGAIRKEVMALKRQVEQGNATVNAPSAAGAR